ncbi:MAG TPA: hypothetical protein VHV30_02135 [Polyangiaceae bacterium]|jgi:hypothetical protein|nr:hypothetical protein [Polyangiaceae bacterium]
MMRKPIPRWLRIGLAGAVWALTVIGVEAGSENEIGKGTRQLEQRIELQLELMERFGAPTPPVDPTPARSHEESIEPWELVGV